MLNHSNLIKRFFFLSMPFFSPDEAPPVEPTEEDKKKAAEEKSKQDTLEEQFAKRADRAAKAEREKILKELGVADPEEAKKLLETARKADDEKKTALEKEQSAREKEAEAAKAAADAILKQATTKLMNAEIKMAANTAVVDKDGKVTRAAFRADAMDDVLLLLNREGIQEEKDGTFTGVSEALANLAKTKPYLLAEEKPTKPTHGNESGPKGKKKGSGTEERTRIISGL